MLLLVCAIVEVVCIVAATIVLLVEAIVLQRVLRLLIFFVVGKVDDVATVLEVVGIAEGRMQLHLAFPPGQLLWHWRRDEFRLWPQRKSRRAAMAATPSSGARGGEWVTLVYPSSVEGEPAQFVGRFEG
jgi:hypothetical protein